MIICHFSLGFDVKDHYKELGGDHAAFYAPIADLNGLRAYQAVDAEGLHTLGTVVVDYRGFRVTAQSIIPGVCLYSKDYLLTLGCSSHGNYLSTTLLLSIQQLQRYYKVVSGFKCKEIVNGNILWLRI